MSSSRTLGVLDWLLEMEKCNDTNNFLDKIVNYPGEAGGTEADTVESVQTGGGPESEQKEHSALKSPGALEDDVVESLRLEEELRALEDDMIESLRPASSPPAKEAEDREAPFDLLDDFARQAQGLPVKWSPPPAPSRRPEQGLEEEVEFDDLARLQLATRERPGFLEFLQSIEWRDDMQPIIISQAVMDKWWPRGDGGGGAARQSATDATEPVVAVQQVTRDAEAYGTVNADRGSMLGYSSMLATRPRATQ